MDLLYSLAEAFYAFMESAPGLVEMLGWLVVVGIPVIGLHELGHALAAIVLLDEDVEIDVNRYGEFLDASIGRIRMRLSALGPIAGTSGSAGFDAARASARDVLLIALAGPAASLLGVCVTALLLGWAGDGGWLHGLLWTATFAGGWGVLNLVPLTFQERRGGSAVRSDGRLALDALRVMRELR